MKKPEKEIFKFYGKTKRLVIFLLIILLVSGGIAIMWLTFDIANESFRNRIAYELGKAIFISALVTGVIKWLISKQYTDLIDTGQKIYRDEFEEELKKTLKRLENKVLDQTKLMALNAASLDSMQKTDIIRLYANRNMAKNDIKNDIEDPDISYLRFIGISFNDFLRPSGSIFHQAWGQVEKYIRGQIKPNNKLDIKILLIDPFCKGAYHRSKAEETVHVGIPSRLEGEVKDSIDFLHKLIHETDSKSVSFDVKLYRVPPINYLVQTDFISYVQQYHFWPQHDSDINIPVLKYQGRRSSSTQGRSMHDDMNFHFDYLWENCSISIHEYVDEHKLGYYTAIREAKIENIYYDLDDCKKRILHLIENTENILFIKGISLKSYYQDISLFSAIKKAATRKVKIKILFIDPDSEQAKLRSFREFKFNNPFSELSEFTDHSRREQFLYKHTKDAIKEFKNFSKDVKKNNLGAIIELKKYYSASESFQLVTDESVLVEQYHYGKIKGEDIGPLTPLLLGGEVPVIEYLKLTENEKESNPSKNMYEIFMDHFNFVFDNFSDKVE